MDIIAKTVTDLLGSFECQPVLFVGAGLSRRYLGTPGWEGVLRQALNDSGISRSEFEYFLQKNDGELIDVGTDISDVFFEWAWEDKNRFPDELYKSIDKSIFLKSFIADFLPKFKDMKSSNSLNDEISRLRKIRPHAVITTNYDDLLEGIFEGYEPIVGKGVLRYNLNSFGEIFHIHGASRDPSSIVLLRKDYDVWHGKSQYFAAKLLTYFIEHPVIIFGYSLGDPNIRTILRDIGRIVADDNGLIPNVLQIVWNDQCDEATQREFSIEEGDGQFRIRVLETNDLAKVFGLLAAKHELSGVKPAIVRALAARVMKLTRKDIPNGEIEVDYKVLESITKDDTELPKMLGLTIVDNENKTHPFTISLAAEKMGLRNYCPLMPIIKKIEDRHGVKLREFDNNYHVAIRTGKSSRSVTHKWSYSAIDLFDKVIKGVDYSWDP